MTAVHQVVPVLAGRDAIGRHTFAARDLLRASGYESEIYAEELRPELLGHAKPIEDLPRGDDVWLLYQCSTGSELGSAVAEQLSGLPTYAVRGESRPVRTAVAKWP